MSKAGEVLNLKARLSEIKQQMQDLGDDRGWRWDSLDGQREEVQAELDWHEANSVAPAALPASPR